MGFDDYFIKGACDAQVREHLSMNRRWKDIVCAVFRTNCEFIICTIDVFIGFNVFLGLSLPLYVCGKFLSV